MPLQPKGSAENGNWSSFQLANSTPPLSVTGSAIAPSARMVLFLNLEPHLNIWLEQMGGLFKTRQQREYHNVQELILLLGAARKRQLPLPEILLWTTASRHPSESQTSECSDLLSRSRATFVIVAQRQPGKLRSSCHIILAY